LLLDTVAARLFAGSTALMWAASKGSSPLVKQLLQADAHVNLTRPEFPVKGRHKHNRVPEGRLQTHTPQQSQEQTQTGNNNNAASESVGDADKIRGREVSALDLALANQHLTVANILRSYMRSKE
jgi:ankyrin repeat protein